MRVAVQKMPGVESVDVSLEEGLTTVRLAPENRVTLEQIRERVRSNGFTPKDAEVRIAGRILESGDGLVLAVDSADREYRLDITDGASLAGAIGHDVIVRARVPESRDGSPADRLQRVELESATGARAPGR